MSIVLLILILALGPVAERTQEHYARKDVAALDALLERTEDRSLRLLCRYRLYPLTHDAGYLDDLPEELEQGTARELALLAGLWGYRASEAPFYKAIAYGRRSMALLDDARALDPDEPYLLLIEGQSLLFRPAIAGGDDAEALRHFRRLARVLPQHAESGISPLEAQVWTWYALRRTDETAAHALRAELLERDVPRLYREFLSSASA